jgi:ribosomal protein L37AE/L43A
MRVGKIQRHPDCHWDSLRVGPDIPPSVTEGGRRGKSPIKLMKKQIEKTGAEVSVALPLCNSCNGQTEWRVFEKVVVCHFCGHMQRIEKEITWDDIIINRKRLGIDTEI